tara:strand:- start:251 stop:358 length:108 start_codon:yes stop_codon:yes gene_type:complete
MPGIGRSGEEDDVCELQIVFWRYGGSSESAPVDRH